MGDIMKPSEFLKIASDFGYSQQVEWAKEAASKSTWKSPQSRGGTRPLRVDTMLRKEKDGTLTKLAPKPREEEKEAALSQPGGADYSEPEKDPGSAKPPASRKSPRGWAMARRARSRRRSRRWWG